MRSPYLLFASVLAPLATTCTVQGGGSPLRAQQVAPLAADDRLAAFLIEGAPSPRSRPGPTTR